jgi:membrane-bound serine protease (ClpP class)
MNSILPFLIHICGFLLIAIELFLVPGVTFLGIAGITMLIIGVIYAFVQFSLTASFLFLILALSLVILLVIWFFKKGINRGLSLKNREAISQGFRPFSKNYDSYLNKTGIVVSTLRPAGFIKINGEKLEAFSQGEFINEGEKIQIIKVEGNKLIVIKS